MNGKNKKKIDLLNTNRIASASFTPVAGPILDIRR